MRTVFLAILLAGLTLPVFSQLPYPVAVEDLNSGHHAPAFTVTAAGDHYYLTASDQCLYVGRAEQALQEVLCDRGETKELFSGEGGTFVVSNSEVTDSSYVYFLHEGTSTEVSVAYAGSGPLTGFKSVAGGQLLFSDANERLLAVDTEGTVTVLYEGIDRGGNRAYVYSHRGTHLLYVNGRVWATDLTADGTHLIYESSGSNSPRYIVPSGNAFYLTDGGVNLYRYPLGSGGELEIAYTVPDTRWRYGYYNHLTQAAGGLLLVARDGYSEQIMRIAPQTDTVAALNYGQEAAPLLAWSKEKVKVSRQGGKLIFWSSGAVGQKLFLTDGTAAGTQVVGGEDRLDPNSFSAYETEEGDVLYLARDNSGLRLRRYDAGTQKVTLVDTDIQGLDFFYDAGAETADGVVFYSSNQGEMHKYDKRTNTYLLYSDVSYGDLNPLISAGGHLISKQRFSPYSGQIISLDLSRNVPTSPITLAGDYDSAELFELDGKPYFIAVRKVEGAFLYRTDGTITGTAPVYQLFSRNADAPVTALVAGTDSLYALENDRYHAVVNGAVHTTAFKAGEAAPTERLGSVNGVQVLINPDEVMIPGATRAWSIGRQPKRSPSVLINGQVFWTYYAKGGNNQDIVGLFQVDVASNLSYTPANFFHGGFTQEAYPLQMVGLGDDLYFTTPEPTGREMMWRRYHTPTGTDEPAGDLLPYATHARQAISHGGSIYYASTDDRRKHLLLRGTPVKEAQPIADLSQEEEFLGIARLGGKDLAITSRQIVDVQLRTVVYAAPEGSSIRHASPVGSTLLLGTMSGGVPAYVIWEGAGVPTVALDLGTPTVSSRYDGAKPAVVGHSALIPYVRSDGRLQYTLYDAELGKLYEVGAVDLARIAHHTGPLTAAFGGEFYYMFPDAEKGLELHHFRPAVTRSLEGLVFHDTDGNGRQDAGEPGVASRAVVAEGARIIKTYTDAEGWYTLELEVDEPYVLYLDSDACFDKSQEAIRYAVTLQDSTLVRNFPLEPVGDLASVRPRIESFSSLRCSFTQLFQLSVTNDGCGVQSGTVSLQPHPAMSVEFFDHVPTVESTTGELAWTFTDLVPGEIFTAYLNVTLPEEDYVDQKIPMLVHTLTADAAGQEVRDTFHYDDVLRCAIDPNDKRSWPSRAEESNSNYTQLDEAITYSIRFQNTGNDTAFTVRLEDQLSTDLDWNTFKPLTASHPYRATLREGGNLEVLFEDILLVDSTRNEPASHGFFTFEILAKENLPDFTAIENTAGIYFDFNRPVITNTTKNTLVETLDADGDGYYFYEDCDDRNAAVNPGMTEIPGNGMDDNCDGDNLSTSVAAFGSDILRLAPNPTTDRVHLGLSRPGDYRYELLSPQAQVLKRGTFQQETVLSLAHLPAGIYLLRLTDAEGGWLSYRLVKH